MDYTIPMHRCVVLGVPIDVLTQADAMRRITALCRSGGQFHIATPNPEMLVEASKNAKFKKVLQNTAMNIPDGIGVVWAMRRAMFSSSDSAVLFEQAMPQHRESRSGASSMLLDSSPAAADSSLEENVDCAAADSSLEENINSLEKNMPQRVTGTDLLQGIASANSRLCPPERIFLLGAGPGVAEKAAEELRRRNPAIQEIGTYGGSPREEKEATIIARINACSSTLLFVAYGAPQQDLWIAKNLAKMPSVKIAIGVGGAFDCIAGKKRRAPRWMQHLGIEWLWRLILEPRRMRRIWRAVIVFPWLVWKME